MKTLSPELVVMIVKNCHPNELAAIAQTNRSYQSESERIIYRRITLFPENQAVTRAKDCLSTLASCHQKALLVESLFFNFQYVHRESGQLFHLLLQALPAMKGLNSLAIMTGLAKAYKQPLIADTLRQCEFHLHTLRFTFDNRSTALGDWAAGHSSLKYVSFYGRTLNQEDHLRFVRALHSDQHQNVFVSNYYRNGSLAPEIVEVFPAFCRVDRDGSPIWDATTIGSGVNGWSDELTDFHVYLSTLSHEPTLHRVLGSIAHNFPPITTLHLHLEDGKLQNVPSDFGPLLSHFKYLPMLFIHFWWDSSDPFVQSDEQKQELAKQLTQGASVGCIVFPDHSQLAITRDGAWVKSKYSL